MSRTGLIGVTLAAIAGAHLAGYLVVRAHHATPWGDQDATLFIGTAGDRFLMSLFLPLLLLDRSITGRQHAVTSGQSR